MITSRRNRFRISPTPAIFYLANPFRLSVLIPVLRNIEQLLNETSRDGLLIYVSPFHSELIDRETRMRQVDKGIYQRALQILTGFTMIHGPSLEATSRRICLFWGEGETSTKPSSPATGLSVSSREKKT